MSRRETDLCDIELSNWSNNSVACPELRIMTCVLCQRDICAKHAMHPKGGVLVRVDSIIPATQPGAQGDLIYSPHAQQISPYPQAGMGSPMLRLNVCAGCRTLLNDHEIGESLRGIEEQLVKFLAAAITAKALETKAPRTP